MFESRRGHLLFKQLARLSSAFHTAKSTESQYEIVPVSRIKIAELDLASVECDVVPGKLRMYLPTASSRMYRGITTAMGIGAPRTASAQGCSATRNAHQSGTLIREISACSEGDPPGQRMKEKIPERQR